MGYKLRDHTADIGVEATGATLSAVFATTADGMAAAMLDEDKIPSEGQRFEIDVHAESREALLFDYLDELIYQRDVRSVLPVENEVTVENEGNGECYLTGSARGVPFAGLGAREIKAVTYSEMVIEQVDGSEQTDNREEREDREKTDGCWRAFVIFDV